MRALALFLGIVLPIMACASEPSFYSFRSHTFVLLAEVPVRKHLVGTWRSNDGRQLMLRPDGKFLTGTGTVSGCWDVDGSKLVLHSPCVNYGAHNSVILTLAEATHDCSHALSGHLVLRDCIYAERYEKYPSAHRSKG